MSWSASLGGAVADSGPVVILAGIAAAGSFTHIRDTATEHGQAGWMAWAIAVCIDLTCVMAARERQRDKRTGRRTGRLSWPTLVLVGGIVLSLAANLAQAEPSVWGWLSAGTPAGAFLVAVSMLERRATGTQRARLAGASAATMTAPPSFGRPGLSPASSAAPVDPSSPLAVQHGARPELAGSVPVGQLPLADLDPASAPSAQPDSARPARPLVDFARRVASEHHAKHGRPITRDALRARLGVSNQLASDLLRQIRADTA